jgi:hypothetical protein
MRRVADQHGLAMHIASSAPASEITADGLIHPELLAELAASAKLVPLTHPGHSASEPRYAPSTALADFVRCRDLTCRWPGCDVPATRCDVDHTIPYAQGGPTHAANLKCLCRKHHIVKTFWGWKENHQAHPHQLGRLLHLRRPATTTRP